ncbi:MAG TPA: hypothetical protein PLJ46_20180 [Burkholderiaceae bacterium]|nr:hypothetical protein [Rhodoferax sp.]HQX59064.1 hypothetical protein [Burkholderiaceae bacterium]HQZ08207.1 hypothetical protein [Burkholderiaceae bacterium]
MIGPVLSTIGGMNSHALAAIGIALHAESSVQNETHGHVHDDRHVESTIGEQGVVADHPHHEADHSHDKSHALPLRWSAAETLPRSWQLQVRPWIETVQASRLERPPMG